MTIDETGLDKMVVDEPGINRTGAVATSTICHIVGPDFDSVQSVSMNRG